MAGKQATVILVHGAWADGSSWSRVIQRLVSEGVHAVAAPLPLTSLADDVAALDRAIERTQGPVLLVWHAYAGAVIGATRHDRVQGLVYVAALAPDEGETVADIFYRTPTHPLAPQLAPDENGLIWLPEDAFATAFAPQAGAQEQAVLAAVQRPISPACITVAVDRPLWRERPSWYFIAEEDRMISGENQRFMANRMGAKVSVHALDHAPMITEPGLVVSTIFEALHA